MCSGNLFDYLHTEHNLGVMSSNFELPSIHLYSFMKDISDSCFTVEIVTWQKVKITTQLNDPDFPGIVLDVNGLS